MKRSFKFSVAMFLILTTLLSGCMLPGDRRGHGARSDHDRGGDHRGGDYDRGSDRRGGDHGDRR